MVDYNPPITSEVPRRKSGRVAGGSESHSSLRSEWAPRNPVLYADVAQLVEQGFRKTQVVGSSPTIGLLKGRGKVESSNPSFGSIIFSSH